jgi:hypothetical protein
VGPNKAPTLQTLCSKIDQSREAKQAALGVAILGMRLSARNVAQARSQRYLTLSHTPPDLGSCRHLISATPELLQLLPFSSCLLPFPAAPDFLLALRGGFSYQDEQG